MSRRKQHLIFVYGTLMRDEIATARFVAEAHTEFCLGHFPAMSMLVQAAFGGAA